MADITTNVIIVGGGPVGIGLAIELGQRNIPTVVVERHQTPQPIPKGQNLTQRTMEHFRCWGVEDEVRRAAPIPVDFGIGGLTAYKTLLGPYHYDWYQRALVRPYYAADNERLPQYMTEEILRDRAGQLPSVTLLFGATAEGIRQDDSGAEVCIVQDCDGTSRTVRGQYLVGADGSHSLVREQAGIGQERTEHDLLMVLLVFRSAGLNDLLAKFKGKSFFNVMNPDLKGYWQFFGRVDTGETWFFHAPVPAGTTADSFDFKDYLHKVVGAPFDLSFDHIGFWDLRVAVASTYRAGRIFIAGDAAHSHPPYGGFGINTGFEDVRNLGWKLAATLNGWAGNGLLESYSLERKPVFVSTARDFIENFIAEDAAFFDAFDPDRDLAAFEQAWQDRSSGSVAQIHTFEPNYEGSPIVFGPPGGISGAVGTHAFEARPGHHLAPVKTEAGGTMFDRLASDFTLMVLGADGDLADKLTASAARQGVPLTVVKDASGVGRADYAADHVLVRPDHYVAWTSQQDSRDPDAIIGRIIGADERARTG